MIDHIPIYHHHNLKTLPRNKDLGLDIKNRCTVPNKALVIDWDGACFLCHCDAWLPVSVGKIETFQSLEEVWNNDLARTIQQDVADKKYSWCAVTTCNIVETDITFIDRHQISINIDESCNLRCPSCRKGMIMLDRGEEFDRKINRVKHVVSLLERFNKDCHIIMSGNGDPLASHVMRPIIHDFHPKPNQTFRLFTNGLLIKKQLEKSRIVPQITEYQISIDAGSRDVYERVRLGGQWNKLIENFDFLAPVAKQHKSKVWLMLVLQKENWRDLQNFADLCERYGWQGIITKLTDWLTWENFSDQDVISNHAHPEHDAAVEQLAVLAQQKRSYINIIPALRTAAGI